MVRAHDSLAEIRLDLRHQFIGIMRLGYVLDLVHPQALPVLIEPLTLPEPEQSFPIDDQSAVSAADGIDQYRVLRMRHPVRAERRISREQVQLGAVISRFRFIDVGQHPPAAAYRQRLIEGFGIWRFALLRFSRLYPLHIFMLGICILQQLAHSISGLGTVSPFQPPYHSADTIIANLLLIHSLSVFDFLTWNWPSWSISTEFYTYILYALAIGVMKDRIWRVLVPVVLLSPLALWILVGDMDTTYDYGIIRCMFGFSAGVLVWNLRRTGSLQPGTALKLLPPSPRCW